MNVPGQRPNPALALPEVPPGGDAVPTRLNVATGEDEGDNDRHRVRPSKDASALEPTRLGDESLGAGQLGYSALPRGRCGWGGGPIGPDRRYCTSATWCPGTCTRTNGLECLGPRDGRVPWRGLSRPAGGALPNAGSRRSLGLHKVWVIAAEAGLPGDSFTTRFGPSRHSLSGDR